MAKNLARITGLPSASTPLSGGELFEVSQKDKNGVFKSRKVSFTSLISTTDDHNELKNIQGGIPSAGEYYHLSQAIHDALFSASPIIGLGSKTGTHFKVDYGLHTLSAEVSGNRYLDIRGTQQIFGNTSENAIVFDKNGGFANTKGALDFYVGDGTLVGRVTKQGITFGHGDSSFLLTDGDLGPGDSAFQIFLDGGFPFDLLTTGLRLFDTGARITQFDNDENLAADSASRVATQHATKTYTDTLIAALSAAIGFETYSGIVSLSNGVSAVNIIYDQAQVDDVYSLVTQLRNEVDSPPSIYSHIITNKTATGFSVLFSGILDSSNYKLDFILSRNQSMSSSSSSSSVSSSSSSSSSSSVSSSSSSSSSTTPLTATYLWNSYDPTTTWINPADGIDGSLSTHARGCFNLLECGQYLLDGNTAPSASLGTITKVEFRVFHASFNSSSEVTPKFNGLSGTTINTNPYGGPAWTPYFDITNDTNAPGTGNWTWTDIVNIDLSCNVPSYEGSPPMRIYRAEIRVTYLP